MYKFGHLSRSVGHALTWLKRRSNLVTYPGQLHKFCHLSRSVESIVAVDPDVALWEKGESRDKGLLSADRNNKATLPLTTPRPSQVVYEGFGAGRRTVSLEPSGSRWPTSVLAADVAGRDRPWSRGPEGPLSPQHLRIPAAVTRRCRSRVDEDLRGVQS